MTKFFFWCAILMLCLPLLFLAHALHPVILLLLLPLRIMLSVVAGVFHLIGAMIGLLL